MLIDLHGMDESDATGAILSSLFSLDTNEDLEIEIITGNGLVLRDLAIELVEEHGLSWRHENGNTGSIIVYK